MAGWSPFGTDLGSAKVVMLWGMNPGASSLGAMRGYTDLQKAGMKIIVVDPRYSDGVEADLWLPLRPGSDSALAGHARTIIYGAFALRLRARLVPGLRRGEHVRDYTPEWAAPLTWLTLTRSARRLRMYAGNKARLHPVGLHLGPTRHRLHDDEPHVGPHARHLRQSGRAWGDGMPGPALNFLTDEEMEARVPARGAEGQADRLQQIQADELARLHADLRQRQAHLG